MKRLGFSTALLVVVANAANAQSAQPVASSVAIAFHVIDEQRHPVAGAAIDLRGATAIVQSSLRTGADGGAVFRVSRDTSRDTPGYSYTIRMIGYTAITGRFELSRRDSMTVEATLHRSVQSLDVVRTDARANRNSYSITGDEIARSGRKDPDAYDVLRAMRPNMFGDRMRGCGYVQDLWINGQRVMIAPWEAVIPMQSKRVPVPMPYSPPNSPLSLIKPAYIAEIRYVSCWDRTAPNQPHFHDALYVTLKPGIGFDIRKGTYVADSASARTAGVIP